MSRPADAQHGVLVLSCTDAPGIVHAVSGLLVDERCTIVESHQFDSLTSGMFYMRVEFGTSTARRSTSGSARPSSRSPSASA